MCLNLTIDRGNTATKLSLWDGDTLLDAASVRGVPSRADIDTLTGGRHLDGVITSAVAPVDAGTLAMIASLAPLSLTLGPSTTMPLVLDYPSTATLGADRIAAAVGAMTLHPGMPLLVADLGTAATFDIVTADGRYLGGVISAGIGLRLDALHDHTAMLPSIDIPSAAPLPSPDGFAGKSTIEAMSNAATLGIVAETLLYRSMMPHGTVTVITGGDTPLVADAMAAAGIDPLTADGHLTGRGLNRILRYNEK